MTNLAKYLIVDLEKDWSKPSIKFFRSNGAHGYIVWLTIMSSHYTKEYISIENIVNKVEKYASRRTILDLINKGVSANFIKKINSAKDKRKILIQPTKITIQEFSEWSNEFIKSIS
mgnify:FL=1